MSDQTEVDRWKGYVDIRDKYIAELEKKYESKKQQYIKAVGGYTVWKDKYTELEKQLKERKKQIKTLELRLEVAEEWEEKEHKKYNEMKEAQYTAGLERAFDIAIDKYSRDEDIAEAIRKEIKNRQ
jgi:predicted  nucleic acid-binding Zn-ribbon protein